MTSFLPGFALGLSLILVIGAQNAFVLRQGIRREHVFAVCATCALSDAVLITAGAAGAGWVVAGAPWLLPALTWGGAAFLAAYGTLAVRKAVRGGVALRAAGGAAESLGAALGTCLTLTWLNPHVYLDTVVLLGSIASTYPSTRAFAAGAALASLVFFFALGYGARLLSWMLAAPAAWRWLDALVGAAMWVLAVRLVTA